MDQSVSWFVIIVLQRVLDNFIGLHEQRRLLLDKLLVLQRSRVNQSIIDTSIEFEDHIGQHEYSILKVRHHGIKSYLDLQVCALERKPRDGQRLGVFGLTVHTWSIFN